MFGAYHNAFCSVVYVAENAFDILRDYITTIADELKGLLSSSAHEL